MLSHPDTTMGVYIVYIYMYSTYSRTQLARTNFFHLPTTTTLWYNACIKNFWEYF